MAAVLSQAAAAALVVVAGNAKVRKGGCDSGICLRFYCFHVKISDLVGDPWLHFF